MKTSTVKWGIKFLAIMELALLTFLFAHASYHESHHPVGNERHACKAYAKCAQACTTDLVVMDDLLCTEPLVNQ
jgi:hypothetical protein